MSMPRSSRTLAAAVLMGLAIAPCARAADVYVLRFNLRSFPNGQCDGIRWRDDIVFHNTTGQDLKVVLLGITNVLPQPPTDLLVPAGRTVTATGNTNWDPGEPIWVVHLDVPEGIVFQSRAEGFLQLCMGGPPSPSPERGAFPLPVARGLTPPDTSRTFLGTDFGSDPSYSNVGVYNGGSAAAQAIIEMRQGCDDTILDRRTLQVPPNTVVQAVGIGAPTAGCPDGLQPTSPWTRYIVVTVDQPSFTYVINRLDDLTTVKKIPYLAPITQE